MLNSDSVLSLDEIFNSFCCSFHFLKVLKLILAKICKIFQDSKSLKLNCVKNVYPPHTPPIIYYLKRGYILGYILHIYPRIYPRKLNDVQQNVNAKITHFFQNFSLQFLGILRNFLYLCNVR